MNPLVKHIVVRRVVYCADVPVPLFVVAVAAKPYVPSFAAVVRFVARATRVVSRQRRVFAVYAAARAVRASFYVAGVREPTGVRVVAAVFARLAFV